MQTCVVFLFFGLGGLHAQENTTASGGEASGTGGTSSYTVGQVFGSTITGSSGTMTQGVQQPFEIFILTGIDEASISLNLSVYPNPTTDYLTLKVEHVEGVEFLLTDVHGKVIKHQQLSKHSTNIDMSSEARSIYFLKLIKNSKPVKTFKIIKN